MSAAGDWAGKWAETVITARDEAPRIRFESAQASGEIYTVVAYVASLNATGEPILGFGSSTQCHPTVALRAPNALLLAHWIIATFGEIPAPVSTDPARAASR